MIEFEFNLSLKMKDVGFNGQSSKRLQTQTQNILNPKSADQNLIRLWYSWAKDCLFYINLKFFADKKSKESQNQVA